jgi:hypothetical protein
MRKVSTFFCILIFAAVIVGAGLLMMKYPPLVTVMAMLPVVIMASAVSGWLVSDILFGFKIPDSRFQIQDHSKGRRNG